LQALNVDDAEELYRQVRADDQMRRWSSLGRVTDLQETKIWARSRATPDRMEWTIRIPTGEIAGRVALHQVNVNDGQAEIGYGLFEAYRGKGLARRVVTTVTTYGLDDLRLHRIILEHGVDNQRSCRVAEFCGYRLEGTMRQAHERPGGGWDDAHLHARLATDPSTAS
jgi:RimJ/RimL family protein N-acetyltransferase